MKLFLLIDEAQYWNHLKKLNKNNKLQTISNNFGKQVEFLYLSKKNILNHHLNRVKLVLMKAR